MCSRAGGAGPTIVTLVRPKILLFMVNALYFQSPGGTNDCQIEALFKWLDNLVVLSSPCVAM